MKRTASSQERRHLAAVAALGCVICERMGYPDSPSVVHHVHVRFGWGRSSHYDTLPLCNFHHVAPGQSVHGMGRAEFTAMYGISELELLDEVKRLLGVG